MKERITKSVLPASRKNMKEKEKDRALVVHKRDGIGEYHDRIKRFMSKHHLEQNASLNKDDATLMLLDQALTANDL